MKKLNSLKKYSLNTSEMSVLKAGSVKTTYHTPTGGTCPDTVEKTGTNLFDDGGKIDC
ncbi:MAG: hypothetical protein H6586_08235 [Flavobacteriales bacterium]|nr:hypothetical protein [Flavobacteriales bacterium]